MKYYDISPIVSPDIGVFPGDVGFRRQISMDFSKGDHLLLSSISTTLHLGAHADASNHYHQNGTGIEQRPLLPYLGDCQVIEIRECPYRRILLRDLRDKKILAPRVLFKTQSFPDPNRWNSDFASLSEEVIKLLSSMKVQLVGIDTPSVDPEDSKNLEAHQEIYRSNICILEGLDLRSVPEGIYTLVALPLRLRDADASPVGAILLDAQSIFPSILTEIL